MTTEVRIKAEKVQYDINRKVAKLSALSPGKVNKYECLVVDETSAIDQSRIIESARVTYSSLGKLFEKQKKQLKSKLTF